MAAPEVLLVFGRWHCLQLAAVTCLGDGEPAVVQRFLALGGAVALQAVDPGRVVPAHLILVDDRRRLLAVALGALSGRPDQRRHSPVTS